MLASSSIFYALLCVSGSLAASVLDCKDPIAVNGHKYDLSSLGGHAVSANRTRDIPPSQAEDSLRISLCQDLDIDYPAKDYDKCPKGTRACLTVTNRKDKHDDVITQVIPIFKSDSSPPKISALASGGQGFNLFFDGPKYPSTGSSSKDQHLNLTLLCASEDKNPEFISYVDESTVSVTWSLPNACYDGEKDKPPANDPPKDGDGGKEGGGDRHGAPTERVGSGMGWFFLVMFLAFGAYFGVGMYYNYSTYGASGWDLVPHRDFWREVPYMIRDVVSHLCSGVRARPTGRGGYVAV